jgi:hypothetical protein
MAEPRPVGKIYDIPPQPPDAAHTRWIPAGVVTIGVEYRDVTPEALVETYRDDPDQLASLLAQSPDGGFADEGVSLHVNGTDDGHEYLRFDVFDGEPHYHYVHKVPDGTPVVNQVVDYDVAAHGEMLTWALECIRHRLPEMLPRAGGAALVDRLDRAALDAALDEVAPLAIAAQAAHRSRA